jgi:hypothetical protein
VSERSTDVIDGHARSEKVELELDAFITKRNSQRRRTERTGTRNARSVASRNANEVRKPGAGIARDICVTKSGMAPPRSTRAG